MGVEIENDNKVREIGNANFIKAQYFREQMCQLVLMSIRKATAQKLSVDTAPQIRCHATKTQDNYMKNFFSQKLSVLILHNLRKR